jgi:hypothetical protein
MMALYELRTYDLQVGKLAHVKALYQAEGWPALEKYQNKIVGYFVSDVGTLNQLVHLWRFDDDADRRAHWETLFADDVFMSFAKKLRPSVQAQRNQLLTEAPWGPHP